MGEVARRHLADLVAPKRKKMLPSHFEKVFCFEENGGPVVKTEQQLTQ